ncbi:photoreceptor cilium actin regulator [Rhinophrynus dorsalis]
MGCSPSHSGIIQSIAKNASKPLKKNKALLPPRPDNNDGITIPLSGKTNPGCCDSDGELIPGLNRHENGQQWCPLENSISKVQNVCDKTVPGSEDQRTEEEHGIADEAMVNLRYQKGITERTRVRKQSSTGSEQDLGSGGQQETNPRRNRKTKRSLKPGRRAKIREKQIDFCETDKKVDFPELLVKAHQDAYAYLNPNLSKYEAVICMANQATQTQLIMQQMISFISLRFDEINQCLEEIADDGEKLLKNVGNSLTWPAGKGDPTEHPDLLQQLLQYTIIKMQTLNGTVASLTSNALQDTCTYLQSAATNLQEKFKVKQCHDERLLRMIKLFEGSASGPSESCANDTALYSEDSGIGGDWESIKESRSPDKMERKTSDSSSQISLRRYQERTSQQELISNSKVCKPASETNCKDTCDLSMDKKDKNNHPTAHSSNSRVLHRSSLTDRLSMNSLDSSTTLEQGSVNDQESEESTDSDDSYDDGEDTNSVSSQITLPERPLTSPAGTGAYKPSSKWLENPGNVEMSLKMKDAISEKIKFVPEKSSSRVWIREEGVNSSMMRPSTADGSIRRTSRHRRSRSAESLRSQAEDPTLLELQRTQKELSKKLEQLYVCNGNQNKEAQQNTNSKSFLHKNNITPGNITSTNKLKACLDKSFTILPSQDRVTLRRCDKSTANNSNNIKENKVSASVLGPQDLTDENILLTQRKLESLNVSPRQSVRKLIQTFSPSHGLNKQSNGKVLGSLRCVRKFGVPVLPPTIPAYHALHPLDQKKHVLSTDDEKSAPTSFLSTCKLDAAFPSSVSQDIVQTDTNEDNEDLENLPPPPLEILMDDSFNILHTDEDVKDTHTTTPKDVLPTTKSASSSVRKAGTSQKIKASINARDLLPSKNATAAYMSADKTLRNREPTFTLRKYSLESASCRERERCYELQRKQEIEQAAHLYKQSHKIIPLQNPGDVVKSGNDGEITEQCTDVPSLIKQKQYSPTSQRRSEHSTAGIRRISPTRVAAPSPSTEKQLTSPPANRAVVRITSCAQPSPPSDQNNTRTTGSPKLPGSPQRKIPSPPSQRKLQSPPSQRTLQSPPSQRKLQSPPSQRNLQSPPSQRRLPSPPSQRKLPSPPPQRTLASPPSQRKLPSPPPQNKLTSPPSQRKLPSPPPQQKLTSSPQMKRQPSPPNQCRQQSPPNFRREPSSPSHRTPSPPVSPSLSQKGIRRSSDEQQTSSKLFGNAQSIFCPSSTSLFEAKSPSPPGISGKEVASSQVTAPFLRHSFSNRPSDDQHRRIATSAANPQPFVRRSYSDRRPRVQLRLPLSSSASASTDSSTEQADTFFDDPVHFVDDLVPFVDDAVTFVDALVNFVDDLETFIYDLVPFVDDLVPFVDDAVPFVDDLVTFVDDLVPFVDDAVPFVYDMVTLVDDPVPFVDDAVPFVDDPVPFVDDLVTFVGDNVTFISELVPFVGDTVPFADDLLPFFGDTVPFVCDLVPFFNDPLLFVSNPVLLLIAWYFLLVTRYLLMLSEHILHFVHQE